MNILPRRDTAPTKPVSTTATVDTIELFFRRPPPGLRTRIESVLGRRVLIEPVRDRTGHQHGVRVVVNRPPLDVLPVLGELRRRSVCRVDIAYDFTMETGRAADAMHELLRHHGVLKWRGRGRLSYVGATTYWYRAVSQKAARRKNRNLALYPKTDERVRLELRFWNSGAVRRAGLNNPEKLIELNPRDLFEHHIKLARFTERFVAAAVRRTVLRDRLRHLGRPNRTSATERGETFLDKYRARIPGTVRAIFERIDIQDFAPKTDRTIERMPLDWLCLPDRLKWEP